MADVFNPDNKTQGKGTHAVQSLMRITVAKVEAAWTTSTLESGANNCQQRFVMETFSHKCSIKLWGAVILQQMRAA